MTNERDAPALLILHALISAGNSTDEKTVDEAIRLAGILEAKLHEARRQADEKPIGKKKDAEKTAEPPKPT